MSEGYVITGETNSDIVIDEHANYTNIYFCSSSLEGDSNTNFQLNMIQLVLNADTTTYSGQLLNRQAQFFDQGIVSVDFGVWEGTLLYKEEEGSGDIEAANICLYS